MPGDKKFKITWISVLLAFMIQAITAAWFLSSMHSELQRVSREQGKRTGRVYAMDNMDLKISWLVEQMRDVEKRLRLVERVR